MKCKSEYELILDFQKRVMGQKESLNFANELCAIRIHIQGIQ